MTDLATRQRRLTKVCFLLRIHPEQRSRYLEAHSDLWPEMLQALHASGYENYSIFVDESGLIVLYFETENLDATLAAMGSTEVNERWGAHLAGVFAPVDESRPVGAIVPLVHAFDLDEQLSRGRVE